MKMIYISGSTLPSQAANAVHVLKMGQAFAENDVDFTLLAQNGGGEIGDLYDRYGVQNNFTIHRTRKGLPRFLDIIRYVFTHPTDYIYGRDSLSLAFLSLFKNSVTFEAHQIPTSKIKRLAVNMLKWRGVKFVAISQVLKDDLISEFSIPDDRILVAHDGADEPPTTFHTVDLKGRKDAVQIGYAGSLHAGKGMELIAQIAPLCPDADFHVIGGTEGQIQKWKDASPNIIFHGFQDHKMIPSYLHAMDILLAPFQPAIIIDNGADIARWTSPLKLFEYMAAQRPILCSDLPVLREVLTNNETAYIISSEKPHEWVEKIRNISKNKKEGEIIAKQAYLTVSNNYLWSTRATIITEFIK